MPGLGQAFPLNRDATERVSQFVYKIMAQVKAESEESDLHSTLTSTLAYF